MGKTGINSKTNGGGCTHNMKLAELSSRVDIKKGETLEDAVLDAATNEVDGILELNRREPLHEVDYFIRDGKLCTADGHFLEDLINPPPEKRTADYVPLAREVLAQYKAMNDLFLSNPDAVQFLMAGRASHFDSEYSGVQIFTKLSANHIRFSFIEAPRSDSEFSSFFNKLLSQAPGQKLGYDPTNPDAVAVLTSSQTITLDTFKKAAREFVEENGLLNRKDASTWLEKLENRLVDPQKYQDMRREMIRQTMQDMMRELNKLPAERRREALPKLREARLEKLEQELIEINKTQGERWQLNSKDKPLARPPELSEAQLARSKQSTAREAVRGQPSVQTDTGSAAASTVRTVERTWEVARAAVTTIPAAAGEPAYEPSRVATSTSTQPASFSFATPLAHGNSVTLSATNPTGSFTIYSSDRSPSLPNSRSGDNLQTKEPVTRAPLLTTTETAKTDRRMTDPFFRGFILNNPHTFSEQTIRAARRQQILATVALNPARRDIHADRSGLAAKLSQAQTRHVTKGVERHTGVRKTRQITPPGPQRKGIHLSAILKRLSLKRVQSLSNAKKQTNLSANKNKSLQQSTASRNHLKAERLQKLKVLYSKNVKSETAARKAQQLARLLSLKAKTQKANEPAKVALHNRAPRNNRSSTTSQPVTRRISAQLQTRALLLSTRDWSFLNRKLIRELAIPREKLAAAGRLLISVKAHVLHNLSLTQLSPQKARLMTRTAVTRLAAAMIALRGERHSQAALKTLFARLITARSLLAGAKRPNQRLLRQYDRLASTLLYQLSQNGVSGEQLKELAAAEIDWLSAWTERRVQKTKRDVRLASSQVTARKRKVTDAGKHSQKHQPPAPNAEPQASATKGGSPSKSPKTQAKPVQSAVEKTPVWELNVAMSKQDDNPESWTMDMWDQASFGQR